MAENISRNELQERICALKKKNNNTTFFLLKVSETMHMKIPNICKLDFFFVFFLVWIMFV